MRSALLLFAFALNTFAAGPLIVGLRGGAPFNTVDNPLTGAIGNFTSTKRFEVGPTLGVKLPLGFSVEGDALYRRETLSFPGSQFIGDIGHSDSWQFPVLLKYRGSHSLFSPVLGAGVTVRHAQDLNNIPSFLQNGFNTSSNTVGFVGAGGVRLKMGPIDVTPEIRYTRWGGDSFSNPVLNFLPFSRNEVSFLVGVTF
jgi:hypothetical protein